ncbi:MAG: HPr family phosphocarrier protein [Lentisphaeria bacterium]|nr:HPr family phosphocarrier protein [Lentisphaeria bacterium]
MMATGASLCKKVRVSSPMGLHARPAAQIVHIAGKYQSDLKLRRTDGKGSDADCRSVLAMLMLAASKDTELELRGCGPDAAEAVNSVAEYFDRSFDDK